MFLDSLIKDMNVIWIEDNKEKSLYFKNIHNKNILFHINKIREENYVL